MIYQDTIFSNNIKIKIMKKISKLIGIVFLFALLSSSVNSTAGRCQDLCIPSQYGTCGLQGDDGPLICGGADNWEKIKPMEP
jgi:hypothetical protein